MSTGKPTVAVVGTGLVGCSLALALKESGYCGKILGFSRTPETLEQAQQSGAVDIKLDSFNGASSADVIILSSPVGAIVSHLGELGFEYRKHHAGVEKKRGESLLILDTGSIKVPIVEAALDAGLGPVFVGGHPMAGSEKSGPAAARADLFKGRTFFLTATTETSPEALRAAHELVKALGAVAVEIGAEEHDRTVALTSHLPYLIAAALSGLAEEQSEALDHIRDAFGGVFRDVTRVAGGSPEMWADILSANSANVKEWLDKLHRVADLLLTSADTPEQLKEILDAIRTTRRKLME